MSEISKSFKTFGDFQCEKNFISCDFYCPLTPHLCNVWPVTSGEIGGYSTLARSLISQFVCVDSVMYFLFPFMEG